MTNSKFMYNYCTDLTSVSTGLCWDVMGVGFGQGSALRDWSNCTKFVHGSPTGINHEKTKWWPAWRHSKEKNKQSSTRSVHGALQPIQDVQLVFHENTFINSCLWATEQKYELFHTTVHVWVSVVRDTSSTAVAQSVHEEYPKLSSPYDDMMTPRETFVSWYGHFVLWQRLRDAYSYFLFDSLSSTMGQHGPALLSGGS